MLAETLREVRASLTAGYVWLLGLWLVLGPAIQDALGGSCGDLQSAGCEAEQSRAMELAVDAADAIGPVGQGAALTLVAGLLGTTVNYFLADALSHRWDRAPEFFLGWTASEELSVRQSEPERANELGRRRSEGMARIQLVLPALFVGIVLTIVDSPWWLVATILLPLALALHARQAIRRYALILRTAKTP